MTPKSKTYKVILMGIETTLTDAGTGLGSFLTSITDPVVTLMIGLGVAGAIVGVIYAIAGAIKMK